MLTIKLAPKTSKPVGSKPTMFPFQSDDRTIELEGGKTKTLTEFEQAKAYARGQLKSTGRAWCSVEDGKRVLFLVGQENFEMEIPAPTPKAKAARA